jgi:uncharacterized protein
MKTLNLTVLLFFLTFNCFGQVDIIGNWEGFLGPLKLVFHIDQKEGKLNSKVDSPQQGSYNMEGDKTEFSKDTLSIFFSSLKASFKGLLGERDNKPVIKGKWKQNGFTIELDLVKPNGIIAPEIKPQTPKRPYNYFEEDVEFHNEDKSMKYAGTLTYPRDLIDRVPAVILLSGSGAQDRDGSMGLHKPFAVIADHLTNNGYAVLRIDDRGIGVTNGFKGDLILTDLKNDVINAINFLETRPEIDRSKIGLIGHSEGGVIGAIVASEIKKISFLVLLASPALPIKTILTDQVDAIMTSSGVSKSAIEAYLPLHKELISKIPYCKTDNSAKQTATSIFEKWQRVTKKEFVTTTTGVVDSTTKSIFINTFVNQCHSSIFRDLVVLDPALYYKKIRCPVLALNGEKDIQVLAKKNLQIIRLALKKNSLNEVIELKELNHLFQNCNKCSPDEYFSLDETFSEEALDIISGWLKKL